ncbi:MAG: hypothetical protein EA404_11605 [Spirochaetaceae bacterium]|nr:MAG: hypothetical protein EA404_11605 [Spirochaetaceae bacterium]
MKLPVRAAFAAIAAAVVLSGCAPDVLVILDPIHSATADSNGGLGRELRRSARAQSARALVVSLDELTADALTYTLETHNAPTVLLPALVGRMALQAAAEFPERRFYLIGRDSAAPAPNVAAVRFDRSAAFEAAARAAVDVLAAGRGVSGGCTLLFLVDSPQRADELERFRRSFEQRREALGLSEAELALTVYQYSSVPDSDALREALASDHGLIAFFLGRANAAAWEVIGSRETAIISEWLLPQQIDARVTGWIEHSWSDALQEVLTAEPSPVLEVAARYVHGPVISSRRVNSMPAAADAGK